MNLSCHLSLPKFVARSSGVRLLQGPQRVDGATSPNRGGSLLTAYCQTLALVIARQVVSGNQAASKRALRAGQSADILWSTILAPAVSPFGDVCSSRRQYARPVATVSRSLTNASFNNGLRARAL